MSSTTLKLELSEHAEAAYLEYAMMVVKGRALAQVEDGQKPVQRRILYAMHELGLTPPAKTVKCARVVGEILGKYHPHGDSSVYEALVRQAQDFTLRYPLIEGQGNFGSRDGDSAAAMRYTEARLSKYAGLLLDELHMGTVDFAPNYDGSFTEPTLLPARLPFLLLNGSEGIAVGMACNIPSHNLREVGAAACAVLENPDITLDGILQHIQGPDFSTGAQLISTKEEIRQAYATGRGPFRCRGTWVKEEFSKGQWQLVITSLPYGQATRSILMELNELLNPSAPAGKKTITQSQANLKQLGLDLIEKVVDESNKDNLIRLVIVPRTSKVSMQALISYLLANTSLEANVSLNATFIQLDGNPGTKGIDVILKEWCQFRVHTVRRRTQWELNQAQHRLHILEGRYIAYLNIDAVIKIIKEAEVPKEALKSAFDLSDIQAEDILEMRLRQLNKLEGIKLEKDMAALKKEIERLTKLLNSEVLMRKLVIKEVEQDIEKFGDDRKTQWVPLDKKQAKEDSNTPQVLDEELVVALSANMWIKSFKGMPESFGFKKNDSVKTVITTRTVNNTYLLDTSGRAYTVESHLLPAGRGEGVPATTLISLADNATLTGMVSSGVEVVLASSDGYALRVLSDTMMSKAKAGKGFMTIKENCTLLTATPVAEGGYLLMKASDGHILLIPVSDLTLGNKGGRGQALMSLTEGSILEHVEFLPTLESTTLLTGSVLSKAEITAYMGKRNGKGKLPGKPKKPRAAKPVEA
jgi:topoisomerase-4 subunit A